MKMMLCMLVGCALLTVGNANAQSWQKPVIAGNGDIRGFDNDRDGRSETVFVRSYQRSDGVNVRSHYRAAREW